jgi:LmbE family N-acetylglucosaminyl deacetylase
MEETPAVVLAVYAHPDDADVGCGGSLARWAKAGSAVHLVVCTDGGKGAGDPGIVPSELAEERADEL